MCALAQMWARTPGADVAVLLQSLWVQAGPFTDVAQSVGSVQTCLGNSVSVGMGAHAFEKVVRNRDDRETSILQMTK